MASQGRARRGRPSYTNLFRKANSDDESDEAEASQTSGPRNGSNFSPEEASESAKGDDLVSEGTLEVDLVLLEEDEGEESEEGLRVGKKGKPEKGKSSILNVQDGLESVHSLPSGMRAQKPAPKGTSTLPAKDHRHRPSSLWCPPSEVTRLATQPDLFSFPSLLPTTSSEDLAIAHRVKQAWMYCVSAGPCWQLLEDRAFYKEEYISPQGGRVQRPLVYMDLPFAYKQSGLLVGQAAKYLPRPTFLECYFGPLGSQQLHKFASLSSVSMRIFTEEEVAEVIYAGGPVTAVDWCPTTATRIAARHGKQYLAIAALLDGTEPIKLGMSPRDNSHASIQVWSLSPDSEAAGRVYAKAMCEVVLCIEAGSALSLKWCPLPSHDSNKHDAHKTLGLLAAATLNGTIGIYMVPEPTISSGKGSKGGAHPSYVKASPMVRLSLPETGCLVLDWANSETIAVGCANGFIAVFYVKLAIVEGTEPVLTHYFPAQQTAVQSLSWVRAPQSRGDGSPVLDDDPTIICSTGTEGTVKLIDLRDCIPRMLVRNREIPHAGAYSAFCGSLLVTDVDFWVKLFQIQAASLGKGHFMIDVGGPALSITVSDMHPILAVGSADGACTTTNMLRGTRREGAVPILNQKVFQLDYSPTTNQYRMLDHFLPRESGSSEGPAYRESTSKVKKPEAEVTKERFESGPPEPSGLWHPSIAVSTVAWNSGCGLASAPWLASGTACGLVRVDYLEGSWMRNTLPYGSVEVIRREGVEAANVSESE